MAGLTSQPSASTLSYAMNGGTREVIGDVNAFEKISYYWEDVRKYYQDFESGMMSPHTEIYVHEMPGGQYSNLTTTSKRRRTWRKMGRSKRNVLSCQFTIW